MKTPVSCCMYVVCINMPIRGLCIIIALFSGMQTISKSLQCHVWPSSLTQVSQVCVGLTVLSGSDTVMGCYSSAR